MSTWTATQMPDQTGRTFVVTGANSGIGLEAARELARKGARVVMACRTEGKAKAAMEDIRATVPSANLVFAALDLASLASIRACAAHLQETIGGFDVLINNAGIMAIPRTLTADGFEMQLGTNHLGHFALSGLLFDSLKPQGRIVSVSSMAHRMGRMRFDDLMGETTYGKWGTYGQSKLANLLFHYELQRRLAAAARPVISVACHPGYSATNLQLVGPQMESSALGTMFSKVGNQLLAQTAEMGALPTLYAATAPDVVGGDYIGPGGFMEWWGYPVKVQSNAASHNAEHQKRLWDESARLTGVAWL